METPEGYKQVRSRLNKETNKFLISCSKNKKDIPFRSCKRCSRYVGLLNAYYSSISRDSYPVVLCEDK